MFDWPPAVSEDCALVMAPLRGTHAVHAYDDLATLSLSVDNGREPLTWWPRGLNQDRFPNLARMVAQFLGCPATSASAERVFSFAGRLYDGLARHMSDGTLEERMWAKLNRLGERKNRTGSIEPGIEPVARNR